MTSLPDLIVTRAFHVGNPDWEPVVSVAAVQHGTDGRGPAGLASAPSDAKPWPPSSA